MNAIAMLRNIDVQFEPIESWPGERTSLADRSPFKSSWTATCDLLERELRLLGVKSIVLEMFLARWQLRNDGLPRADARPHSPGVIISFQSSAGALRYPCDRFDDWHDNVRAIALALEALRKVDRYGVTKRGEQYRGWAALLPPTRPGFRSDEEARAFLRALLGPIDEFFDSRSGIEVVLRNAECKTHPDKGGNANDFKKVQQARELLLG